MGPRDIYGEAHGHKRSAASRAYLIDEVRRYWPGAYLEGSTLDMGTIWCRAGLVGSFWKRGDRYEYRFNRYRIVEDAPQ